MTERGLGHLPDQHDARDRLFSTPHRDGSRPTQIIRRHLVRTLRDQGPTNSCVGHATASGYDLLRTLDGEDGPEASPLGIYYPARAVDGYHHEDRGSHIRSAMRVLHRVGVPSEEDWPFRIDKVNDRPSIEAEMDGALRADGYYERIWGAGDARLEMFLDALESGPVVFGTLVNDSFMDHQGPHVLEGPKGHDHFFGGHAVVAIGYDEEMSAIEVQNSWGLSWGVDGIAMLSFDWIRAPTTSDVWAMRRSNAIAA